MESSTRVGKGGKKTKKRIRSAKTTKVALERLALLCSGDMCVCACVLVKRHVGWMNDTCVGGYMRFVTIWDNHCLFRIPEGRRKMSEEGEGRGGRKNEEERG